MDQFEYFRKHGWLLVYRDDNGKLRDDDGLCNSNWPSFDTDLEAEDYIEENDIRATVVSVPEMIRQGRIPLGNWDVR